MLAGSAGAAGKPARAGKATALFVQCTYTDTDRNLASNEIVTVDRSDLFRFAEGNFQRWDPARSRWGTDNLCRPAAEDVQPKSSCEIAGTFIEWKSAAASGASGASGTVGTGGSFESSTLINRTTGEFASHARHDQLADGRQVAVTVRTGKGSCQPGQNPEKAAPRF